MTEPEQKIRFRPIDLGTAFALIPFRNSPEVQEHLRNQGAVNQSDQAKWFVWLMNHKDTQLMLAIEHDVGGKRDDALDEPYGWQLVGCGGMTWISWPDRRAELSVYTYPTTLELEAARLLVDHGFRGLGLNRIEAETLTPGRAKLVHGLGFKEEGDRCEAYWRDGGFIDATRWGLLARDWSAE